MTADQTFDVLNLVAIRHTEAPRHRELEGSSQCLGVPRCDVVREFL